MHNKEKGRYLFCREKIFTPAFNKIIKLARLIKYVFKKFLGLKGKWEKV